MKTSFYQNPIIKTRPAQLMVGLSTRMSLTENKNVALWQSFGPLRKTVPNVIDKGSYSIQIYHHNFATEPFLPTTVFTKWAGVGVIETQVVPEGLETMVLEEGKWAVFVYKGITQDFGDFAQYIYGSWLPTSGYILDDRPHFEYMAEDYLGSDNPEAQEEVWIPIK